MMSTGAGEATSQFKMDLTAAPVHVKWIAGSAPAVQPSPSLITGIGSNVIKLGLNHC